MTEPTVVARGALTGLRVGLSVSESADLATLGLTPRHCELVVAEFTRALLLAGATVVYGGRLRPEGYTQTLLDEAQRFSEGRAAIEIFLAQSEYEKHSLKELDRVETRIAGFGVVRYVRADGRVLKLGELEPAPTLTDVRAALSAMRTHVTATTQARVLVGGRLTGFVGRMPGVIEEAVLSASKGDPIYAAAGFGGAASAVARRLSGRHLTWAPDSFPDGIQDPEVRAGLSQLRSRSEDERGDGLTNDDRLVLAGSHRPADLASVVVRALARRFGKIPRPD